MSTNKDCSCCCLTKTTAKKNASAKPCFSDGKIGGGRGTSNGTFDCMTCVMSLAPISFG